MVTTVNSSGSMDTEPEDQAQDSLEICAEDIMRAITNKDAKALAMAIKAAVELIDTDAPQEEAAE